MGNRKKLVYISIGLVLLLAILVKIAIIEIRGEKSITSFYDETKNHGVSVEVEKIKKIDYDVSDRTTVVAINDLILEGYVDLDLKNRIKENQLFSTEVNNKEVNGKVIHVSNDRDFETGLYKIILKFNEPIKEQIGKMYQIEINTIFLVNVIVISIDSLVAENKNMFVWLVENGVAKKRFVKVGIANGEKTSIIEGLKEGDEIVTKGMSKLKEGSKVRIINCKNC